jgi:hypothetical protein
VYTTYLLLDTERFLETTQRIQQKCSIKNETMNIAPVYGAFFYINCYIHIFFCVLRIFFHATLQHNTTKEIDTLSKNILVVIASKKPSGNNEINILDESKDQLP